MVSFILLSLIGITIIAAKLCVKFNANPFHGEKEIVEWDKNRKKS